MTLTNEQIAHNQRLVDLLSAKGITPSQHYADNYLMSCIALSDDEGTFPSDAGMLDVVLSELLQLRQENERLREAALQTMESIMEATALFPAELSRRVSDRLVRHAEDIRALTETENAK